MKDKTSIDLVLTEFNKRYPRPGIEPIAVSREYDLESDWPEKYPNVDSAGVYMFLDEKGSLLYVGKTSCNSSFGARFSAYFIYGPDKRYKVKNDCYSAVRKILTIPLPKGHEFEAGAIEEYLIWVLNPVLNVVGKNASNTLLNKDAP